MALDEEAYRSDSEHSQDEPIQPIQVQTTSRAKRRRQRAALALATTVPGLPAPTGRFTRPANKNTLAKRARAVSQEAPGQPRLKAPKTKPGDLVFSKIAAGRWTLRPGAVKDADLQKMVFFNTSSPGVPVSINLSNASMIFLVDKQASQTK